jgi:hypothetical protein
VPCGGLPTSLDVTGDRLDITVCTGPPEGFGYWLILGDRPATGPAVDYPREDLGAPLAGTYRHALMLPPTIAAAHASAAACDKCLPDRTLTVFVVRVDKTNSPQLEQYRRTDAPLPPGSTAWVQVSAEQTVP